MKLKRVLLYFSKTEIAIILISILAITSSYIISRGEGTFSFIASLIGVFALMFSAKGNPIGQALVIIFSTAYGIISFSFGYYGEVITYAFMTGPMAVASLISWIRNPYEENHSEVKTERLTSRDVIRATILTPLVTLVMFFALKYFGTANLFISTVSVTTSFVAVYLTYKRSIYFTLAYAANDVVLIALWLIASIEDLSCLSVAMCFAAFLLNDIYGYISWRRMQIKQDKKQNLNTDCML